MKVKGIKWGILVAMMSLATVGVEAQEVHDKEFNFGFHAKGGYTVGKTRGVEPNGRFHFNHLMVEANGRLSRKLSYRYVQRFNKDLTTYPLENLSNAIDYAYLKYQASDRVSITAGRQALLVGGFEFQEYPIDVYDFSWYGNNITCYLTGVSSHFRLSPTQEIGIQLTNNRTKGVLDSFGNSTVEPLRFPVVGSLAWNSSYIDNKLQLRYGASVAPLAKDKMMWTIGAGHKVDLGRFNIYLDLLYYHSDLDYLGVVRGSGIAGESIENTDYLSTIVEASYFIKPEWELHAKAIYDMADAKLYGEANGAKLRRQLYQASLQYHPMEGKHCYLFLNGTYQTFGGTVRGTVQGGVRPDQFRVSLGAVMRLSLFSRSWD